MRDGKILLVADTHCEDVDLSRAKKYFGSIGVGILLGDIFDEYKKTPDRWKFFQKLKKDVHDLVSHTIVLEGNHDERCTHFEKKYKYLPNGQLSKRLESSKKTDYPLKMIKAPKNKLRFTKDLLEELGYVESYVCIREDGKVLRASDDIEKFPGFSKKKYDLYVSEVEKCPKMVLYDKNSKVHLITHHQNSTLFDDDFLDYFHGHYHGSYKNGDQISSTIFKKRSDGSWMATDSFSYKFALKELKKTERHTPCISFFLDRKKKNARLELIPGIYGDWMVYDRGKKQVFYWSRKKKWMKEIDIEELFGDVLGAAGVARDYQLNLA